MRGGEPIELCLVGRVGKRPLRFLGGLGQPGPSKHFDYVLEGLAHWTSSRSWPGQPPSWLLLPAFRRSKATACSTTAGAVIRRDRGRAGTADLFVTKAVILDSAPAAHRD
jgi:hypothetical protein